MGLKGKTVFITDGDSEIGCALGKLLAEQGCNLMINCKDGDIWGRENNNILKLDYDLSIPNQARLAIRHGIESFGSLDILIHNNNKVLSSSIELCQEDIFMDILNENTKSAFLCTQAVASEMIPQKSGKILYISSVHDEKPTGSAFAYSVSKGAVKMLCSEAALDLGRYNIQVSLIEVGAVKGNDELYQSDLSYIYEDYTRKIPDGKYNAEADIAIFVKNLLEDENGCLNGESIRLDRGYVLHYVERPEGR